MSKAGDFAEHFGDLLDGLKSFVEEVHNTQWAV